MLKLLVLQYMQLCKKVSRFTPRFVQLQNLQFNGLSHYEGFYFNYVKANIVPRA